MIDLQGFVGLHGGFAMPNQADILLKRIIESDVCVETGLEHYCPLCGSHLGSAQHEPDHSQHERGCCVGDMWEYLQGVA